MQLIYDLFGHCNYLSDALYNTLLAIVLTEIYYKTCSENAKMTAKISFLLSNLKISLKLLRNPYISNGNI